MRNEKVMSRPWLYVSMKDVWFSWRMRDGVFAGSGGGGGVCVLLLMVGIVFVGGGGYGDGDDGDGDELRFPIRWVWRRFLGR